MLDSAALRAHLARAPEPAEIARLLKYSLSPMQEAVGLLGPQALHDAFSPEERVALRYVWPLWARRLQRLPDPPLPRKAPGYGLWRGQLPPPGPWSTCLYMAGRGSGKTRFGAEMVRKWATDTPGIRIAMVGATAADVWGTMLEGESGLLSCCPPWDMPQVVTTKRRVKWRNGSMAILYSADKPKRLRGPQFHKSWADEVGAWRYLEAYDQLQLGMRLGQDPQTVMTTTPLPIALLRETAQAAETALLMGSSRDNAANLAAPYFTAITKRFEGTTLGRQELDGELLDEIPGAIWQRAWFRYLTSIPKLQRVAVGLDPAETSGKNADDTGIVVSGLMEGGHGIVLEDASVHASPDAWARKAVEVYKRWKAGVMVVDVGRGGEMAQSLIKLIDATVRIVVKGGNRGKRAWAEPVSALYEQGRVHHLAVKDTKTGRLTVAPMEDQMVTWTDDVKTWSPDRMDAAVYGLTELMLGALPDYTKANVHAQRRTTL